MALGMVPLGGWGMVGLMLRPPPGPGKVSAAEQRCHDLVGI